MSMLILFLICCATFSGSTGNYHNGLDIKDTITGLEEKCGTCGYQKLSSQTSETSETIQKYTSQEYESIIKEKDSQITKLQVQLASKKENIKDFKKQLEIKTVECEARLEEKSNQLADQKSIIQSLVANCSSGTQQINELQNKVKFLEIQMEALRPKAVLENNKEILTCESFENSSKIEVLQIPGIAEPFSALCDAEVAGSGWIVIQRRFDGSVNFDRIWEDYRFGFGNLNGEFFFGLEKLHQITKWKPHELYIQLKDYNNRTLYVRFEQFEIENEESDYMIKRVGNCITNATNVKILQKNIKFNTRDKINCKYFSCVGSYGWWHIASMSNLNVPKYSQLYWEEYNKAIKVKSTKMMIKPKRWLQD
ncbi:fibroleukin isoform X2 [Scaptodrosophila lebanonensis]|uniref:Fibroleukin isoform X2 n=1 Tax=Drosophila lebanonensis TaxID=7225 RepID=A0A6J2TSB3_DROLE|nr:fibroleukin isoform X2 [Scaptodrosophila lebanonensis]